MSYFVKCARKISDSHNCFTVGKTYEVTDDGIVDNNGFLFDAYKLSINGGKNTVEAMNLWFAPWYAFELFEQPKVVVTTDGVKVVTATKYEDGKAVKTATAKCAPEDTFDFMVGAKLAMERLNTVCVGGFKVGDRVNHKGHNGTIICIKMDDRLGVEFDDAEFGIHNCGGFTLKAGAYGTKSSSLWLDACDLAHGEAPKPKYYNGKVVCIKTAYPWWTVGKVYEVKNGVIVADDRTAYPPKGIEPYRDMDEVRHAGQGESNRYNSKNEFIPFVEG